MAYMSAEDSKQNPYVVRDLREDSEREQKSFLILPSVSRFDQRPRRNSNDDVMKETARKSLHEDSRAALFCYVHRFKERYFCR